MEEQCFRQGIFSVPLKNVEVQKPMQAKNDEKIHFIQQFVSEVLDFSSQYGSDTSISYTAYNLTGKPSKFPDYGDFPQAFVMKTYGNWWREVPSRTIEYMPQNTPKISSHDYVDICFEESVYPFRISIYETYNPGAVVRIWAQNADSKKRRWTLLWEGEPLKLDHIPQMFSPIIKTVNFKSNLFRIEFNHSKLEYYTGIDAVLLVGTAEPIKTRVNSSDEVLDISTEENSLPSQFVVGKLTQQIVKLNLHSIPNNVVNLQKVVSEFQYKNKEENISKEGLNCNGRFQYLPNETILKILSYLDLITLRRCAQLNRHFYSLCNDSFLYTSLSLKPYWDKLYDDVLLTLTKNCQHLQKLDLSWCGSYNAITPDVFEIFITACGKNLTHIRLNCCKFVTNGSLKILSDCKNLKEIGLRNCNAITDKGFYYLANLSLLENIDLYRTSITSESLIAILKANPNLLHLNLGSCIKINLMDEVALTLASYNKKLISLDLWKALNLTHVGVMALSQCFCLEEVDFGWCLGFTLPVDGLTALASGCRRLKKLFLTAVRWISDKDLEPFLKMCPDLEQIDLLGVRGITSDICLRLLMELPKLRLLDLSFCDQISDFRISTWKRLFPNISIKRSFQTNFERMRLAMSGRRAGGSFLPTAAARTQPVTLAAGRPGRLPGPPSADEGLGPPHGPVARVAGPVADTPTITTRVPFLCQTLPVPRNVSRPCL